MADPRDKQLIQQLSRTSFYKDCADAEQSTRGALAERKAANRHSRSLVGFDA